MPNATPERFTVAAGSLRYTGEMALNRPVFRRPAAAPMKNSPIQRAHVGAGGPIAAKYKSDAQASADAVTRTTVSPRFASIPPADGTDSNKPRFSARK